MCIRDSTSTAATNHVNKQQNAKFEKVSTVMVEKNKPASLIDTRNVIKQCSNADDIFRNPEVFDKHIFSNAQNQLNRPNTATPSILNRYKLLPSIRDQASNVENPSKVSTMAENTKTRKVIQHNPKGDGIIHKPLYRSFTALQIHTNIQELLSENSAQSDLGNTKN